MCADVTLTGGSDANLAGAISTQKLTFAVGTNGADGKVTVGFTVTDGTVTPAVVSHAVTTRLLM